MFSAGLSIMQAAATQLPDHSASTQNELIIFIQSVDEEGQ